MQDSNKSSAPTIPPPLNIPPSRARRQLAARLAQKKKDAEAAESDPDAVDAAALETASRMPENPSDLDLGPATEKELEEAGVHGFQITGLRTLSGAGSSSKFSGLFGSDDSSSDSSLDEDDAGRDETLDRDEDDYEDDAPITFGRRRLDLKHRRPSTTEAKERRPLDDDDDDENDDAPGLKPPAQKSPFDDPDGPHDLNSSDEESAQTT